MARSECLPSAVAQVLAGGRRPALAGCQSPAFDPAIEQQRLLERDAEWARVASAGTDVEKTISYWSDDAVITHGAR